MAVGLLGSPLSKKHGIYLDRVGIAAIPEDYEKKAGRDVSERLSASPAHGR